MIGVLSWIAVSVILVRGRHAMRERTTRELATRIVGTQGATLLVVLAGALLVDGVGAGLY